jgi:hypothetical protein
MSSTRAVGSIAMRARKSTAIVRCIDEFAA